MGVTDSSQDNPLQRCRRLRKLGRRTKRMPKTSPKGARLRAPARTPTSTLSAQNLLPSLSLLSLALLSSKSFSLCGWRGLRCNQATVQPTDPNLAIWKSESGSFSGNSPPLSRLQKCVILLPTFIQSCVKLHLMLHELFKL